MRMKFVVTFFTVTLLNLICYSQTDSLINISPDGVLKESGVMIDGKKEGLWKEYSDDGFVRWIWTYRNDKKDGVYQSYYNDGSIEGIGYNKDGLPYGIHKVFDRNGKLVCEMEFEIKSNSSIMTNQTFYNPKAKPDGTIEVIEGKTFVWLYGKLEPVKSVTTNE